jgi:phosphate butyryltransferase
MNHRNQIKSCYIEGPLALDNAVSKSAAQTKGLTDEVSGDADILLVPDIDAGNVLYKSLNFLAKGRCAALIMGAKVPVVLTSRADSEDTKLMSIALAAYL